MNRKTSLAVVACAATVTAAQLVRAQALQLTGTSYSQNFDGIGTALPTGWTVRTGANPTSLGSSVAHANAATSWATTTGNFRNAASSNGLLSTDSAATQSASTDRALAIRQTAGFGDPGAAFTLQVGNTVGRTAFSLSFQAEMLSVQSFSTTWLLQYGLGATPGSFTNLGTFTDPGTFGSTTINANAAISGIENQNQNVWLRVVALDAATGSGSRDTFGINNFNLVWTGVGPSNDPRNLTWNGSSGNWETANNWLEGVTSSTFESTRPDNAIFTNGALPATVTLGTAITAGSIHFQATAPVHTLSGGGSLNVSGNLTADQSVNINVPLTIGSPGTWAVASGKTVNVGSAVTSLAGITKTGTGTVVFATPSPAFISPVTINAGTVRVNSVDAANISGIGNGSVTVNSGGELVLENVQVGQALTNAAPNVLLNLGGTLRGEGSSVLIRSDGLKIPTAAAGSVNINSSGTLRIGMTIRNTTNNTNDSPAVIHIGGGGRVLLTSGAVTLSNSDHFTGSWVIDSGILQVGPTLDTTTGDAINALGYNYGSININAAARPVTANSGGVLAGAIGIGSGNFKSPITLNGGGIGAINADPAYSGSITVKTIGGGIALADVVDGSTPRTVSLVNNTDTPGNFTWEAGATLAVTGNGTLDVARNTGTVSVGAGAQAIVSPQATVNLGGVGGFDLFSDGTNRVGITNSGTFNVTAGTHVTGLIQGGGGTTTVAAATNLNASGIRQKSLTIGNAGVAAIKLGATANLTSQTSIVKTLSIDGGPGAPTATLDLNNNSMILDYDGAPGTQAADVRRLLRNGVTTARGIISSSSTATTRLGYGDNSVLLKTSFAGQSPDGSSVLIKFTFVGDADLDGDADGVDIGKWATNFTGELSGAGNSVWTQGDWDYDGDVDGVDAGLWATAFTGELSGGGLGDLVVYTPNAQAASILQGLGITVVPEPASLGLLAAAGACSLRRARRRRHG